MPSAAARSAGARDGVKLRIRCHQRRREAPALGMQEAPSAGGPPAGLMKRALSRRVRGFATRNLKRLEGEVFELECVRGAWTARADCDGAAARDAARRR